MLHVNFKVGSAALIAVVASVLATSYRRLSTSKESAVPPPAASQVEVVRLAPAGDPHAGIECSALDWVHFTYQVSNDTQAPITGLKLGTECACERVGEPPATIPPGEIAPISFRLRAPRVGMLQRTIPLVADGASQPLAMLEVALRVNFTPPSLVSPMQDLNLTFIHGDGAPREIVLEAIEARERSPWITSLVFEPSKGVQVDSPEVDELPEADPTLTRRRYHFPVVNLSLPIARQLSAVWVRTNSGLPSMQEPLSVWIDVVDPVSVVPNPLVINHSKGSVSLPRRVCVVDRTGAEIAATPAEFDQNLLHIERAGAPGGSTAAFDIVPSETADSATETRVVFNVRDNETRELVVRFEPSERP